MEKNSLKSFNIIDQSGNALVSLKIDQDLDPSLFSGFLSAIFSFGSKSMKEQMSKLSLESDNLRVESFVQKFEGKNYIAVGLVNKNIPKSLFRLFAESILEDFFKEYKEDIISWNGNISIFDEFKDKIKQRVDRYFSENSEALDDKIDAVFDDIMQGDLSSLDDLVKKE